VPPSRRLLCNLDIDVLKYRQSECHETDGDIYLERERERERESVSISSDFSRFIKTKINFSYNESNQ